MARKTQQVEVRLVAEYLKDHYSKFPFTQNQPLGLVSEELLRTEGYVKGLGMQRPSRPAVDAVVFQPNRLILVEGKVWHIVDGMAKLPLYKSLIPTTPELKQYRELPVVMELVVPWSNSNLVTMCAAAGIQLSIYKPAWIDEVVARVQNYGTRDYRLAREEKLKNRAALGLD